MKEFIIKVSFKLSDKVIADTIEDTQTTSMKNACTEMFKDINKESEENDEVPMEIKIVEWNEKELK